MQRENEAIQKIYWLAVLATPGPRPTLSSAPALASLWAATGSRGPAPKPPPSRRQETWGIGGISYLKRYIQAWVGGASSKLKRAQRPKVQR